MVHALGYKPDVPDSRDLIFSPPKRGVLPKELLLSPAVVKILNQGSLGSCVANAGFQAIRTRHVLQMLPTGIPRETSALAAAVFSLDRSKLPRLGSRLMGYYLARKIDHTEKFDAGTHVRSFFRGISHFGFADEELWPYSDLDANRKDAPFRREPPSHVLHAAYDRRSPVKYERIIPGSGAFERVKEAIAAGFPVVFGVDVDEKFVDGDFDLRMPIDPPAPSKSVGGHAMMFSGYTQDDRAQVVNSWGTGWGGGGCCWFSRKYVEVAEDLWVVEHAPVQGEV